MAAVLRIQHTSVPMPRTGRDDARRFYGEALQMTEIIPPSTLDQTRLVWFKAGDGGVEVHVFSDEHMEHKSSLQHLCLQVDDIEAIAARLSEYGYPPRETEKIVNRPRFFVDDPFGNLIEITQITGDFT